MKKLRVKNRAIALISACAFLFLFGCKKTAGTNKIPISDAEKTAYAQEFVLEQTDKLYAFLDEIIFAVYETKPKADELRKNAAENFVLAFEKSEVSPQTAALAIDKIISDREKLIDVLTNKYGVVKPVCEIYNSIVGTCGIDAACETCFYLTKIYCNYNQERYLKLYNLNPQFEYLKKDAETWAENANKLDSVGRDNFGLLVRILNSASTVFLGGKEFLGNLNGGEAAVFIRELGQMLEDLNLSLDDKIFLLSFSKETPAEPLKMLFNTSDEESLANSFEILKKLTAKTLTVVTPTHAEALFNNDYNKFLSVILNVWNEQDYLALDGAFSFYEDESVYENYYSDLGILEDYNEFKNGLKPFSIEDLKTAKTDLYAAFYQFICYKAPAVCFEIRRAI